VREAPCFFSGGGRERKGESDAAPGKRGGW